MSVAGSGSSPDNGNRRGARYHTRGKGGSDSDSSGVSIYGNTRKGVEFAESLESGSFLFAMVMSYTETCEIPGLSAAGASIDSFKLTPPADAEYLHYGYCKTLRGIPVTPDGKPTPAVMTKAALESASIPHMVISAGSSVTPQLPYVEAGLKPGRNIRVRDAMTIADVVHAMDRGRIVGRSMAPLADCIIIGESIPAGTTTAMAVLYGLGFHLRVSSSMPENPVRLKEDVMCDAFMRVAAQKERGDVQGSDDNNDNDTNNDIDNNSTGSGMANQTQKHTNSPGDLGSERRQGMYYEISRDDDIVDTNTFGESRRHTSRLISSVVPRPPDFGSDPAGRQQYLNEIVAAVGDPMIPFVAGMMSAASVSSKVLLAGGTQMAAVLAFASGFGYNAANVAVGTTAYVAKDPSADFAHMISCVAGVPALAVDPGLESSQHEGLRAFARGYAKEGVGAGGCMISSMLKTGMRRPDMTRAIDAEYARLFDA